MPILPLLRKKARPTDVDLTFSVLCEIKAFAVFERKRTPLQSISAAGFARFMEIAAVCAVVIVKRLG